MNETVNIILAFLAGLVLGTLFFGGLWFTVKRAVASTNPSIVILVSFVLRMAIVLVGFYLVGSGNLQRFVIALAGFIIARFLVIHFTKTKPAITEKEANHET
jgi:F1F0 ATPase subunit 2